MDDPPRYQYYELPPGTISQLVCLILFFKPFTFLTQSSVVFLKTPNPVQYRGRKRARDASYQPEDGTFAPTVKEVKTKYGMRLKATKTSQSKTKRGKQTAPPGYPVRAVYPPLPGPVEGLISDRAPPRSAVSFLCFLLLLHLILTLLLASHHTRARSVLLRVMLSAGSSSGELPAPIANARNGARVHLLKCRRLALG